MSSASPEDYPITGLCVVADPAKCPPGYDLLFHSEDKKDDCDLWKDSFFKSRVTRYLCFTRAYPTDKKNLNNVLVDIVIQNEKESPPAEYTLIEQTVDTGEKATRKKQICIRMLPAESTNQAITKLIILSKSKRAPSQFTMAGEINGLLLCYKYGPVPQSTKTYETNVASFSKPAPAPTVNHSNSTRTAAPMANVGPSNKQLNNHMFTHPLSGVPFQISNRLVISSGAIRIANDIHYRSMADIQNEYSYNFSLERSIVNKSV